MPTTPRHLYFVSINSFAAFATFFLQCRQLPVTYNLILKTHLPHLWPSSPSQKKFDYLKFDLISHLSRLSLPLNADNALPLQIFGSITSLCTTMSVGLSKKNLSEFLKCQNFKLMSSSFTQNPFPFFISSFKPVPVMTVDQ